MLEDYEMKLNLFLKFQKRIEIVERLEQLLIDTGETSEAVRELLIELKDHE